MAHEWIVTWLFRCINFTIMLWLFCYIVVRYILPRIIQTKQDQADQRGERAQTYQNLLDQKSVISAAMENDQKLCAVLKRKILVWKTGVAQEQLDHEKDMQVLQQQVQARVTQQAQARSQMRVMQAVVPEVFDRARAVLYERYSTQEAGHEYLQKIMHHIKDRT